MVLWVPWGSGIVGTTSQRNHFGIKSVVQLEHNRYHHTFSLTVIGSCRKVNRASDAFPLIGTDYGKKAHNGKSKRDNMIKDGALTE